MFSLALSEACILTCSICGMEVYLSEISTIQLSADH